MEYDDRMRRLDYQDALDQLGLLETLAPFDPHVVGTLALGVSTPDSDIDIACHAPDARAFAMHLWELYREFDDFSLRQWVGSPRPVIASFSAHGWPFEIFGAVQPVAQQAGWRHFLVEGRLLAMGGNAFHAAVMALRNAGQKTEPAFAAALGLIGDPYHAMLDLQDRSDEDLAIMLRNSGFSGSI